MARKDYFEIMDIRCEEAYNDIAVARSSRDPASYFINLNMIHPTKETSRESERLFRVTEDGSLAWRTDEFK